MREARYAIYFAPPHGSPLERFGAAVLGYDPYSGGPVRHIALRDISTEQLHAVTEEPRRYGFHGTFKAPFRLAPDRTEGEFLDASLALAAVLSPIPIGALAVTAMDCFIGLTPVAAPSALPILAAECVACFDPFRAPLTPEEISRRTPERLDLRGRALLERWGYPYVFERFRFHMTLTGPIESPDERALWLSSLTEAFEPFSSESVDIDALTIFRQNAPGEPFIVVNRHLLGGESYLHRRSKSTRQVRL